MRIRAALNHYLSNYDIIFTDIIEAILGKTAITFSTYDKTINSEKIKLREYLSKLMTEN
jgi:hypothetical protein